MITTLIKHRWKGILRSPALNQNIGQSIFIGLFVLYIIINLLALGVLGGGFLRKQFPDENIYIKIGGYLLYYFLFELIVRAVFQKFPILDVRKYLHLNFKKSSIVHYLLSTSIFSYFNYLPLFAFIPFILVNNQDMQSYGIFWPFFILIVGVILLNNYLGSLIDKYFRKNSVLPIVVLGTLFVIVFLDFKNYLNLSVYLLTIFTYLTSSVMLSFIPLGIASILYFINYRFLSNHLYVESLVSEKVSEVSNLDLGFLERFGKSGRLMKLEAQLIWRNKRSKSMVLMAFLMLAYPMLVLQDDMGQMGFMRIFVGIYVPGIFALTYGQLMLSWNSQHFDLIATRNIMIEDIFRAKYYLLALSCVVFYILSLAYGFKDVTLMRTFTATTLFTIGVVIFLYMLLASYNSKKIDAGKGAMFNHEGIGIVHYLIILPIILLPFLVYFPFSYMGYPLIGEAVIAVIGIIGIVMREKFIKLATGVFNKNRYKIMAAFRKKN